MVCATFDNETRSLFAQLKGQTFNGYEFGYENTTNKTYGNIRLYFSNDTIELNNIEKQLDFFGETNDIACFSCKKADGSSIFIPYIEALPVKKVVVGEKIIGVEIITDEIDVNNGEYTIVFDQAVIIRTVNGVYMFSKSWHFSEIITISNNDCYEKLYSIDQLIEDWSDEGDNEVCVTRKSLNI